MLFVFTDLALHRNLSLTEIHWKDSLCFLRGQEGKTMFSLYCVFVKLKTNSSNSLLYTLTLYTEKAFPHTTQNLRKLQMASEVKPPKKKKKKKDYLLIISKILTNRQKNNKTDWSQQIYVHIHIKKRAVSGVGERGG